jgi:TetR/AcrR family transcriptional regulator, transcriptional repressor for nem operon
MTGMGRPRLFDKTEVLAVLRDQFWERGFAATSLDDLMKATGLGKGSLYAAFGDKHQLFLAVLDHYIDWRLEGVRKALAEDRPAIERLRAFFWVDPLEGGRGCLLVKSTTELALDDPEVKARARRTFGAVEAALTQVVREAIADGDLARETDAEKLGRLLLAVSQGMEFLARTGLAAEELEAMGKEASARLLGEDRPRARKR